MLDLRDIPAQLPLDVRERIEACRAIRRQPLLLKLIEGLWAEKCTGCSDLIPPLRDFADVESLIEISDRYGWAASPFTVGLSFSHRLGQLYSLAPHLRLISNAIVAAVNGTGATTITVSLPARHGKTELAARRTIEWFSINNPTFPALYVSSTDDAANTVGRLTKNDLSLHSDWTGVTLADDSHASGKFNTVFGGEV